MPEGNNSESIAPIKILSIPKPIMKYKWSLDYLKPKTCDRTWLNHRIFSSKNNFSKEIFYFSKFYWTTVFLRYNGSINNYNMCSFMWVPIKRLNKYILMDFFLALFKFQVCSVGWLVLCLSSDQYIKTDWSD